MQPAIPLRFVFDDPEPEKLDPDYLHILANAANTSSGVYIDLHSEADREDADATAAA
jgi:hypothetical protein